VMQDATTEVAEEAREDLLLAGEVCHILRPVVYALLRRRRPETSWSPIVVSLLVELSGCVLFACRRCCRSCCSYNNIACLCRLALSAAAVKPKTPASGDKTKDEIAARKVCSLLPTRDQSGTFCSHKTMIDRANGVDGAPFVLAPRPSIRNRHQACRRKGVLGTKVANLIVQYAHGVLCMGVIQAADVLDYVPGVGKLFRFGTTAVLDYYHQFHFYTSAS